MEKEKRHPICHAENVDIKFSTHDEFLEYLSSANRIRSHMLDGKEP